MKFGELTAVLSRPDRAFVTVHVDGESGYSEIDTDGIFGSFLKDFEVVEMAIVKGKVCVKLKGASE